MNQEQAMMNAERKRTRAILTVLVPITVVMIVLAIIAGVFANKAGNKYPVTAEDFVNTAYGEKYTVYDIKEELGGNIESALVAKKEGSNSLSFIIFKNKGDAKSFFAGIARKYKGLAQTSGVTNSKEKDLENYAYYSATANGKYMHVVRVNKTVLFADVSDVDKEDVQRIVKKLNY